MAMGSNLDWPRRLWIEHLRSGWYSVELIRTANWLIITYLILHAL